MARRFFTLIRRRWPYYRVHDDPPVPFYRVSRVLPHEVAEAEEIDSTPEWGKISSTDTGLDSVEEVQSSKSTQKTTKTVNDKKNCEEPST